MGWRLKDRSPVLLPMLVLSCLVWFCFALLLLCFFFSRQLRYLIVIVYRCFGVVVFSRLWNGYLPKTGSTYLSY